MDIDPQKIVSTPLFFGVAGALIATKFAPGISWLERITNASSGAACAGLLTPAVGEMFKLSSTSMLNGLAFVIGMFGMSIVAAIMQGLRDLKVADIITGWISRKG